VADHSHVLLQLGELERESRESELEAGFARHGVGAAVFVERVDQLAVLLLHRGFVFLVLEVDGVLRGGLALEGDRVLVDVGVLVGLGNLGDFEVELLAFDAQPALSQNGVVYCIRFVSYSVRFYLERVFRFYLNRPSKFISHWLFVTSFSFHFCIKYINRYAQQ